MSIFPESKSELNDTHPDWLSLRRLNYRPDDIPLVDTSSEIAKLKHVKNQVHHADLEFKAALANLISKHVGEMLSSSETREDALELINAELEKDYGLTLS